MIRRASRLHGEDGGRGPAVKARLPGLLALAAIGVAAALLRLPHLMWGLPGFYYLDEYVHFVEPADRADRSDFRDLRPITYTYPTGYPLTLALVLRVARTTGAVDCAAGTAGMRGAPCQVLVGRTLTTLFGLATVFAVFAAARTWLPVVGALAAALALAVMPFHALYGRLVNPDIALTFWVTATLATALRAQDHAGWLGAASLFAGLATATKYPGVFAFGPVLAGLVAHARAPRRSVWRVLAVVASAAVVGGLLGCPRCVIDAPAIIALQRLQARLQMLEGWPGIDLYPGSPLAHRWVYQLAAVLPFSIGWPLYLLAMLGAAALAVRPGWPRTVLAAFALPFLGFMGASRVSPPRYFLPLLPVLALAVGEALAWLTARLPRARAAVVALFLLAIAYSAALAASLAGQIDFSRQRAVAAWLTTRARERPPLTAGYPDRWLFPYDGALASLDPKAIRWLFMPFPRGGTVPDYPGWLARAEPEVMVWPSFLAIRARRNYPGTPAARLVDDLEAGRLAYRLAAEFPTHYLTERWYTILDPSFATQWELGIVGYRIFEHVGAPGAAGVDTGHGSWPDAAGRRTAGRAFQARRGG